MPDVDQLVGDRRHIRQQAQPSERVDLFVQLDAVGGHAGPAHTVVAVTAGNEVAADLAALACVRVGDAWPCAVPALQGHLLGVIDSAQARLLPRLHQIASEVGLAVHHHPSASQCMQVDPMPPAIKAQVEPFVRQAVTVHAVRHAGLAHQVDRGLLEHAGPDTPQHVLRCMPFEQHGVDA